MPVFVCLCVRVCVCVCMVSARQLYMARLGMMTQGVGPILLVRGNQESVMTFSS